MLKVPVWFDLPVACLAGAVCGVIVGWINFDHGLLPMLTAALKQAAYTFLATGLVVQFCRWLTLRPYAPGIAICLAIVIPLLLNSSLLFLVHSLKGTPKPLLSIIPGSLLTLAGLFVVSWRTLATRPDSPAQD